MQVRIDEIKIGKRIRNDVGDIADLMESISKFGLLNPITITEEKELIAGYRRLEACRALGHQEIECRIIQSPTKIDRLLMEADENLARKDLSFSEVEAYMEEKRYLTARGLEKFRLWILRWLKAVRRWFIRYILRREP